MFSRGVSLHLTETLRKRLVENTAKNNESFFFFCCLGVGYFMGQKCILKIDKRNINEMSYWNVNIYNIVCYYNIVKYNTCVRYQYIVSGSGHSNVYAR